MRAAGLLAVTALAACSHDYAGYRWTPFAKQVSGPSRAFHVWFPTDFPEKRFTYGSIYSGSAAVDAPALEDAPRRPVVIVSHGLGDNSGSLAYLCEQLARNGFVCASVDHALDLEAGDPGRAIRARLVDIFNLYDHLRTNADRFGADPDRLVLVGYALGGLTALLAIGVHVDPDAAWLHGDREQQRFAHSMSGFEWPDKRLFPAKAVALIAPFGAGLVRPFGEPVPISIVSGEDDDFAPPATNGDALRNRFRASGWTVEALSLGGAKHRSFINACSVQLPACEDAADGAGVRKRVAAAVREVVAHLGR
jgi:predicted dienelactone hydrolase